MKPTSRAIEAEGLAINGGAPLRSRALPGRRLFGEEELEAVRHVFEQAWINGVDFGYQGEEEERYCRAFSQFQGGGYTDAVATGTVAILVALMALDLPKGSDVVVSPITDPGCVTPILMLGHRVVIADSSPDSFNVGAEQFAQAITTNTRAAVLTHMAGIPMDIGPIKEMAETQGIHLVEDCSQAHGALYKGERVGTFGEFGCFSTMFSKVHATGGCGGLVHTRSPEHYWRVRAAADRGKDFSAADFNPKDAARLLFPAINLNLDELSCAIGRSTLAKLEATITRRLEITSQINKGLNGLRAVHAVDYPSNVSPSPFFHTIGVNAKKCTVTKLEFAMAVAAEGIAINPGYRYLVADWPWLYASRPDENDTPNARKFRDSSFNILFHEKYSDDDVDDIVSAIRKVDQKLRKE